MKEDIKPITYCIGIFDEFKNNSNLDEWSNRFPEIMWGLGYDLAETDCIDKVIAKYHLNLKSPTNKREEYKNILYVLEHSDQKTRGDMLFSYWRYFSHWSMNGYDEYDADLCQRLLILLEDTYD